MSEDKAKSLINVKNIDFSKEPLFFGESLNLQRYDKPKYKKIYDLFLNQVTSFWVPQEVDLTKDRADFQELSDHEKFIFTKNLGYQILLDSLQSRGIPHLLEDCSNPEFEALAKAWEFFETIHSFSYTHIIKNVYPNPSEIFDNILTDPEIIKRTTSVTRYYDDLINGLSDDDEYERKKKLYLTLVSINILEGIRFYVSFACSYCFAQNKTMEGNSKIISLINRDENLHLAATQNVLKYLRNDASEGFKEVVEECEPIVESMFRDAAQEEMEWAAYLFRDGSMLGLNEEILVNYMKHLCNRRTRAIGVGNVFEDTNNPITWIKNYTESKHVQNAPQETEIESYRIGAFKQDTDNLNLDEFKF